MNFNIDLGEMKQAVNLERLKQSLADSFATSMKAVDGYLQKAVFGREISTLNQRELKQLLSSTDRELQGLFGAYVAELRANWRGLFDHRYKTHQNSVYTTLHKQLNTPKSLLAYADKVFDKPLKLGTSVGISLDELTKSFSKTESERIIRAIRLAHHESLPNAKLIQMIRGSKAMRYQDGILATTTRNAQTIARTGTAIMASGAKQAFINDNLDIIDGIKVVATLDSRTSPICRDLDQQIMPIETAVYPPYHYNCRSSFEIVYKGYVAPTHRASEHGVVDNVNYYEWLKQQGKAYQEQTLGKLKAKVFDTIKSAEQFVKLNLDKAFAPMTLDELIADERTPAPQAKSLQDLQHIKLTGLTPRPSEVARLQHETVKRGEMPKLSRPSEAELADLLQQYFGIYLVRYDERYHKVNPTGNPPDFAKKDTSLPVGQWQTYDVMYTLGDSDNIQAFLHSITKSDKAWESQKDNIIKHLAKADIVPLDLRKFDKPRLDKIINFVLSLPKHEQDRILVILGDEHDYDK